MWALWIAVGIVIGWLLFKRPDKMTEIINWLKSQVGLGSTTGGDSANTKGT